MLKIFRKDGKNKKKEEPEEEVSELAEVVEIKETDGIVFLSVVGLFGMTMIYRNSEGLRELKDGIINIKGRGN